MWDDGPFTSTIEWSWPRQGSQIQQLWKFCLCPRVSSSPAAARASPHKSASTVAGATDSTDVRVALTDIGRTGWTKAAPMRPRTRCVISWTPQACTPSPPQSLKHPEAKTGQGTPPPTRPQASRLKMIQRLPCISETTKQFQPRTQWTEAWEHTLSTQGSSWASCWCLSSWWWEFWSLCTSIITPHLQPVSFSSRDARASGPPWSSAAVRDIQRTPRSSLWAKRKTASLNPSSAERQKKCIRPAPSTLTLNPPAPDLLAFIDVLHSDHARDISAVFGDSRRHVTRGSEGNALLVGLEAAWTALTSAAAVLLPLRTARMFSVGGRGGGFTTYIFRNKLWTEILTLLSVGLHSIGLCICPFYFYDWHIFLYRSAADAFQCWPFRLTFPLKTLAHGAELICYFLNEICLFCFWVMGTLSILHNYCAIFSLSLHNYFSMHNFILFDTWY